jgi:hypothetical protein
MPNGPTSDGFRMALELYNDRTASGAPKGLITA